MTETIGEIITMRYDELISKNPSVYYNKRLNNLLNKWQEDHHIHQHHVIEQFVGTTTKRQFKIIATVTKKTEDEKYCECFDFWIETLNR